MQGAAAIGQKTLTLTLSLGIKGAKALRIAAEKLARLADYMDETQAKR